jgi:hypothetical protein
MYFGSPSAGFRRSRQVGDQFAVLPTPHTEQNLALVKRLPGRVVILADGVSLERSGQDSAFGEPFGGREELVVLTLERRVLSCCD